MALPLAVFEDRDVLAAQTGSAIAALPIFSPSTEHNTSFWKFCKKLSVRQGLDRGGSRQRSAVHHTAWHRV